MRPSDVFLIAAFAALCLFGIILFLIQLRAATG